MESGARLWWELYIDCPHQDCGKTTNLVDHDDEGYIARAIFSNKWNLVEGYKVECPYCGREFKVSKIEY